MFKKILKIRPPGLLKPFYSTQYFRPKVSLPRQPHQTRFMASSRAEEDLGSLPEGVDVEEKYHARGNHRGGRDGRGKGRGGGGTGGGGRGLKKEIEVSKALSKLLRHAAEDVGIKLDEQGFAPLDQVMNWSRLKSLQVTFPDILTAVNDNAKNRFSMKANPKLKTPPSSDSTDPSDWVIRANQGHSIAVESASILSPITIELNNIPELVVHGTYFAFYQSILDSGGLKKNSRTHIHCSTGLPEDKQGVISGMRKDAELLIYVDVRKSLEDGKTLWWISENGVLLTEGDENGVLSPKYFKKVVGRKEKECGVLWEDGEKVAELPEPLKNRRAPFGKDRLPKSRGQGQRGSGGGSRGRGRGGKAEDTLKADGEASTSQP